MVVCMVGGMMDGSHGSCDDGFSSVVGGCETVVVCMVGCMLDGSYGSCEDGFLFCCERV
jgi:hypothetical protein